MIGHILSRSAASVHPVDVAAHGVDLAIMGDQPIGVRQLPAGEGVGREALVDHGNRGRGQRVAQILVEAADLTREQQALVHHGAGREARHVQLVEAGKPFLFRHVGKRILRLLADGEQLALECVLIGAAFAAPDDRLANHGHLVQYGLAQTRRVDGHIAPANQLLTFLDDQLFEMGHGKVARSRITRQEAHGDAIMTRLRQSDARAGGPVTQQIVGNLNQDAGAIAQQRVGAHRAAMIDLQQYLETTRNGLVRLLALDVRNESDATCVMLIARIVQTLVLRIAHPAHIPSSRPSVARFIWRGAIHI
jgi:hypothetical protein